MTLKSEIQIQYFIMSSYGASTDNCINMIDFLKNMYV